MIHSVNVRNQVNDQIRDQLLNKKLISALNRIDFEKKKKEKALYFFEYFIDVQIGLEEKIAQDNKIYKAHACRQDDGERAPNRHDRVDSDYVEDHQRTVFYVGQVFASRAQHWNHVI